jgi:uncharacterized membrane protein
MFLRLFLLFVIITIIDFIYLYFIKDYFAHQISIIQGAPLKIDYFSALLCYILLVVGLYYFIIKPKRSIFDAFILGLVIYGVFETTSKALFSKWSWTTVFIDSVWGAILFALTTYVYRLVIQ